MKFMSAKARPRNSQDTICDQSHRPVPKMQPTLGARGFERQQPGHCVARAFGIAAEYIPVGGGALVLLALLGSAVWTVHLIGGVLLLGRLIHGLGLSHGRGPGPARMIGMVLTLLALIAAAVLLIVVARAG